MRETNRRNGKERGNSILEFALVAIPTVVLMLGVVVFGIDLGRSVQVAQISRDAASMYVRGVDFSLTGNQQVLVRLGTTMNLQLGSGDGLIILSKVTFIPDSSCGSPGSPGYPNCTSGKHVLMQRITFGNTALPGTHFPTHGSVTPDAQGNIPNYSTDPNAVIDNFAATLQLKPGEQASYVSEAYFQTTDVKMNGFAASPGVYAQSFF